jgi:hypothetical protein
MAVEDCPMLDTAAAPLLDSLQEGQHVTIVEGLLRQCTGQIVELDDDMCVIKPDGWLEGAYVRLPRHVIIATPLGS